MNEFMNGWHVMYTMPRHERKVANELITAKINYYLPLKKELRKWHDRKKFIDVPLFKSYVFVKLKNLNEYYEGLKIEGVLNYVRFGKDIARVSDKDIDDLRILVDSGEDIEVSAASFQPGQQLFISQGPLTGISCEIVRFNDKDKILVRIHFLQRNLLISLPASYLLSIPAKNVNDACQSRQTPALVIRS
jgi:transcription antitermination factor NusG